MELKITSYKTEQELSLYDLEQFNLNKIKESNQLDYWLYLKGYFPFQIFEVTRP